MERNINALFEYECKRQPELAALVERIDTLTEDEIAAVPVKLPWMRKVLLQMKRDAEARKLAVNLESLIVDGVVSDTVGWMRAWVGPSMFIQAGRTGLEMHPGQLVWLGHSGVWIDTIFVPVVPSELMAQTRNVEQLTRSEYNQAVRRRMNGLTNATGPAAEPERAFRIYRP